MFGRKKDDSAAAQDSAVTERTQRDGAKNRPTPKRRDQEAARKRPLVATDRKSAKSADRAARRENAQKMREAMVTGDEKHLPARDKGPVRRYIRDTVDARFNLGEWLLPLMLAVLVLSLFAGAWATYVFLGVYILIIIAILDAYLLWRRTKVTILDRFGADTETRGLAMYLVMRAFQIRRSRMPKPMVDRGATPR
ncbi:MAG: DUF3043 domain-containing protein [Janibacter sp.]|nr:DUF3043 domain-containing protein [Janibacter sp.]